MSNIWKLYGLGCVNEAFIASVKTVRDAITNMDYYQALVKIDNEILMPFQSPLGHLDAQLFYDSIFNPEFWAKLESIKAVTAFKIIAPNPTDPPAKFLEYSECCRVIGLACIDPWRGQSNPTGNGFREALNENGPQAVNEFGFSLDTGLATTLQQGLSVDVRAGVTVQKVMDDVSADWDPVSFVDVSGRNPQNTQLRYLRFQDNFPQGWIKRAGTHVSVGRSNAKRKSASRQDPR